MGDAEATGTSRREMIKKAVVAGGAIWAVPVIDSVLSPAGAQSSPVTPGLYRASFDGGSTCTELGSVSFVPPSRIPATNGQQCAPSTWNNLAEFPGTITSVYESVTNTFVFTILPSNCSYAEVTRGRCNQPHPCCQNGVLSGGNQIATHDPCACCETGCGNTCGTGPTAGCEAGCANTPFEILNMVMTCV